MWGCANCFGFGLTAAVGTSIVSMLIAAIGAWFGGWIDELIQRITEVNLVLPYLSILIMVGTFYSKSIWVMLGGLTIALNIFTGAIKTDRAIFLQVKESTYIEAARAYGASDWRIITRYLVPRIIPCSSLVWSQLSRLTSFGSFAGAAWSWRPERAHLGVR